MPVETLPSPLRQPVRVSSTPPRLRPKAPLGPAFNRQSPAPAPRQSAVERLEADKAKYVKSQGALSKQPPVRAAEPRRPPLTAAGGGGAVRALQPTRKTPSQPGMPPTGVPLNMEHLSSLISGVNDGSRADQGAPHRGSPLGGPIRAELREVQRSAPPAATDWTSPAKVRLKACGPAKAESRPDPALPPATGTVRRVDVVPQVRAAARKPAGRPPLFMRQPLYPVPAHGLLPLRPATSYLRLFPPRSPLAPPVPLKPFRAPPTPSSPAAEPPAPPPRTSSSSSSPTPPALRSPRPAAFPPSSPAATRLSSSSSRKRPSLTRSKSDMSDRFSRAGTELERFFNLCGLDPSEVQDMAVAPGSDVVSLARFRSASAPGSECTGLEGEDEEEEEEEGGGAARVPYGVSVIEKNARVIKWLYGIRQEAKDLNKTTNM